MENLAIDEIWKLTAFFGIQYVLGRRGSYPYGVLVGFGLFKITVLVVISDIIQTIILLNFFEWLAEKIPWLKKKRNGYHREKSKTNKKKWVQRLKKYKEIAVVAIAALPYGGGALTSSIFAISIKLPKKKAFFLIVIGCIMGSLIFYLAFSGIISLISPN